MPILNLIANIVLLGVIAWIINAFIPMPGAIKSLVNLLVLVVAIIYILQFFGIVNNVLPMLRLLS